jgi:hypothetical protein
MNVILVSVMNLHRCEDCPIRCQAAKKPRSIFARIHHWHTRWWPGWRIYTAELRARKVSAAGAAGSD